MEEIKSIAVDVLISLSIFCVLYWIYKCIVLVKEDQIKIVESLNGRYVRTISGIRGKRAATEDDSSPIGELIDGKDNGDYAWIWYGFEFIKTYKMRKIVRKKTSDLTPEEKNSENHLIAWGDPNTDTEVSMYSSSTSDHYRAQFTYEMHFDSLETGRENNTRAAQNVKVRIRLNLTVRTKNGRDTMYQEGDGGKWLTTLHSIALSCLNELVAKKTYASLSDLRSVKLDDQNLSDGKTFKERINEQMLTVKHLGQETIDLDFLDYEIMNESKPYAKSLQANAIAVVDKDTAILKGEAKKEELKPIIEGKIQLMTASKDATKELYGVVNQTVVEQTKGLPSSLRVFAGNLYSPTPIQFDTKLPGTDEIIKESLAHDIAQEVREDDGNQKNHKKQRR